MTALFTVDPVNHAEVVTSFMHGFLPRFLQPGDVDHIMSNQESVDKIVGAFVLSIASDVNNETREMVGDAHLKTSLITHIMERFPSINEDSAQLLTELAKKYVDKKSLSQYSIDLGFDKLILSGNAKVTKDDREDVFEAFIGALAHIGHKTLGPMFNSSYTYMFVDWFYSGIDIDITDSKNLKDNVTWYKELVLDFINVRCDQRWQLYSEERKEHGEIFTCIKLKKNNKVVFTDSMRGEMVARGSKKKPHPSLYESALRFIEEDTGITRDNLAQKRLAFFEKGVAPYTKRLVARMKTLGFRTTDVKLARKDTEEYDDSAGKYKEFFALLMRKDIVEPYYQVASGISAYVSDGYIKAVNDFLKRNPAGDIEKVKVQKNQRKNDLRKRGKARPRNKRCLVLKDHLVADGVKLEGPPTRQIRTRRDKMRENARRSRQHSRRSPNRQLI